MQTTRLGDRAAPASRSCSTSRTVVPSADHALRASGRRRRRRSARGRARPRRAAAARGLRHQRAADRGRLLLAAREVRRRACGAAAAAAGTPRAPPRRSSGPRRPRAAATRRFSSTVRPGNSRRPSGTSAMPERHAPVRRDAGDVGAVEEDPSRRAGGGRRRSSAGASSCRRRSRRRARPSRPASTSSETPRTAWQQAVPALELLDLRAGSCDRAAEVGVDRRRRRASRLRARRRR